MNLTIKYPSPFFFVFFYFFLFAISISQGQINTCTNANFEQGNFNGWTGTTGNCCPSCNINSNTAGIVNGQHTIMSGAGNDPNSCNNIPYVYPDGGLYSARLGNAMTGAEGECLSYQFTVAADSSNALFIYRFAVIMEDPSHTSCEQPRFNLTVRDQSNNIIPCGSYSVAAGGSVPGFQNCGSVRWRQWTSVGIDVSAYIGQTLTARFCTGDCHLGGHFGYAYIDAICMPLRLNTQYCVGDNVAIITAPPGFSYLWNNGATTQTISVTGPVNGTTYSVTLTSVLGCQVTLNTVLQPVNPTAAYSLASLCYNAVQFSDSSMTPASTTVTQWQWNFGDGTTDTVQNPVHTYASQNNYTVTLVTTNSAGCKDTITKTVNTAAIPIPDFTSSGDCVINPVNFSDQSSFPGGSVNQWHWDFGETGISTDTSNQQNPSYTYSAPGTYNVMLVAYSNTGCNDTIYKPVTINSYFNPAFTPDTFCNNEPPLNLTSVSSGGTWSGTGITNSSLGTFNPNTSGIGIFPVTYIGGTGDCRDSSTQNIIVDGVAITGVSSTNVSCYRAMNGTLTVTATGAAQYTINNGSGPITQTNGNFTGLDTGTYLITVTSAINNCQKTSSAVITEPPLLTMSFASFDAKCYNQCDGYAEAIPGGGTSPYSYSWSNNAGNIPNANNLCDGFYTVTITDSKGCTKDTSFIIAEPNDYSILINTVNSNCGHPDGSAEVFSIAGQTPPYSYAWNNGISDSSNTGLVNGNYILTITDANNCDTVILATVGYNPPPTATAAFDSTSCFGSCDGSAVVFPNGGNPPGIYTYLWSNGQTNATATGMCAGAYTVTVYDNELCEGFASVFVPQPSQVSVEPLPDDTICIDSVANIGPAVASGGTPPYTYLWDFNNLSTPAITDNPTAPKCYSVTVTDANNCQSLPKVQCISIFPPLSVFASGSTTICEGRSVDISAFAFGGNPNNPKTYTWSDGNTNQFRTITPAGNYYNPSILTVTVSDNCAPSVSDVVTINFFPQPTAQFTVDTTEGCEADPVFNVIFTNTSYDNTSSMLNNPISCLWQISDGSGIIPDCDTFIHFFPNVGFYDVRLSVISEFGCFDDTAEISYIKIYPKPAADFSFAPQPTTVQDMIIKFTDLSQSSNPINQWQWSFYDNDKVTLIGSSPVQNSTFNFSSEPDNSFIYYLTDTGNYPVQLLVKTDKNCVDSITKEVRVDGVFYVNVPNAFTPNNDGINDVFFPVGVGIQPNQDFRFLIFNRWGDVIFESKSLDDPWDGTARSLGGKNLVEGGVYVWKLELRDATRDQLKHKFVGHVTLIR